MLMQEKLHKPAAPTVNTNIPKLNVSLCKMKEYLVK